MERREHVNEWPIVLRVFKRFAKKLVVCMDNVFYVRKTKESDVYVPVFPLVRMICLKIVHDQNGHLGRHKL